MKYLFCVHSPRRAQDSAWRFDLVFFRLVSPGGAVGEYRPRCRVVPKWLAIAAAVHLVHNPGISLESLPSLPGIGFEPSIIYFKCRRIPGIWVFSINTIKSSFFLADSSLPSLLTLLGLHLELSRVQICRQPWQFFFLLLLWRAGTEPLLEWGYALSYREPGSSDLLYHLITTLGFSWLASRKTVPRILHESKNWLKRSWNSFTLNKTS